MEWYNSPWLATITALGTLGLISYQIRRASEDNRKAIKAAAAENKHTINAAYSNSQLEIHNSWKQLKHQLKTSTFNSQLHKFIIQFKEYENSLHRFYDGIINYSDLSQLKEIAFKAEMELSNLEFETEFLCVENLLTRGLEERILETRNQRNDLLLKRSELPSIYMGKNSDAWNEITKLSKQYSTTLIELSEHLKVWYAESLSYNSH